MNQEWAVSIMMPLKYLEATNVKPNSPRRHVPCAVKIAIRGRARPHPCATQWNEIFLPHYQLASKTKGASMG